MTPTDIDPEALAGTRIVRTFRVPRGLLYALGREAAQRGLDLTALVLRVLHGYLTYFTLPEAAIAQLEEDRASLRMDRSQYLAHLLYHRCLALQLHGPGFDAPSASGAVRNAKAAAPLGAAGGGAHCISEDLPPGGGVWPYGPPKQP